LKLARFENFSLEAFRGIVPFDAFPAENNPGEIGAKACLIVIRNAANRRTVHASR